MQEKMYLKPQTAVVKLKKLQVQTKENDVEVISKLPATHLTNTPENYQTFLKDNCKDYYRVADSLHYKERIMLCVDLDLNKNKKIKNKQQVFSHLRFLQEKYPSFPYPTYINEHKSGNMSMSWLLDKPVIYYDVDETGGPKVKTITKYLTNAKLGVRKDIFYAVETNPDKSKMYRVISKLLNSVIFEGDNLFTGWVTRNPYYDGIHHKCIFMQEANTYSFDTISKLFLQIARDMDYSLYTTITSKISKQTKDYKERQKAIDTFYEKVDVGTVSDEAKSLLKKWRVKVKSTKRKEHRYNAFCFFLSQKKDLTESEALYLLWNIQPVIEKVCCKPFRHSYKSFTYDVARLYSMKDSIKTNSYSYDEAKASDGRDISLISRKLKKINNAIKVAKYPTLSSRDIAEELGLSKSLVCTLRNEGIISLSEEEMIKIADIEGISSYINKWIKDEYYANKLILEINQLKNRLIEENMIKMIENKEEKEDNNKNREKISSSSSLEDIHTGHLDGDNNKDFDYLPY